MPYQLHSDFGPGPRQPLDRDQRMRWRTQVHGFYMAGKITATALEIGRALVDFLGADGRCDPSHAAIARRAGASVSTVQRALGRLAELGLITWVRRLVRDGSRVDQTSNAYVLRVAKGFPLRDSATVKRTDKPEDIKDSVLKAAPSLSSLRLDAPLLAAARRPSRLRTLLLRRVAWGAACP